MSQEELAGRIGRVEKYYADIERGYCGMSLQTMLSLADCLDMSLDYMILGKEDGEAEVYSEETNALIHYFNHCPEKKRKYALQILKIFLFACEGEVHTN